MEVSDWKMDGPIVIFHSANFSRQCRISFDDVGTKNSFSIPQSRRISLRRGLNLPQTPSYFLIRQATTRNVNCQFIMRATIVGKLKILPLQHQIRA